MKNRVALNVVFDRMKSKPKHLAKRLSPEDVGALTEILSLLTPFHELTVKWSGVKYTTVSSLYPYVSQLLKSLESDDAIKVMYSSSRSLFSLFSCFVVVGADVGVRHPLASS